jgi:hypothetical protein
VSRRLFNLAAATSLLLWVAVALCWFVTFLQPRPRPFASPAPPPVLLPTRAPTTTPFTAAIVHERVSGGGSFRLARSEFLKMSMPSASWALISTEPIAIDVPGLRLRHSRIDLRVLAAPGTIKPTTTIRYSDEWSLEGDYWLPAVLLAVPPLTWLFVAKRRRRVARNACPWCGYDLRATPDQCPECGKVIVKAEPLPSKDPPPPPTPRPLPAAERMLLIRRIAGRAPQRR